MIANGMIGKIIKKFNHATYHAACDHAYPVFLALSTQS